MANRGRKPTPTALKRLRGNPGHRSLPAREARPAPALPEPPARLTGYARRVWRRTAERLHKVGLLTEADLDALELYALAAQEYREAMDALQDEGKVLVTDKGSAYINPRWNIAQASRTAMLRIMTEFGMTPSSRTKVTAAITPEEDALEAELFGASVKVRP